jgi:hypothetical protein
MTDQPDEFLQRLKAALDVDPTPGFEARVQARVQQESREWMPSWMPAAAAVGAVALVMTVAGSVFLRHEPVDPPVSAVVKPSQPLVSEVTPEQPVKNVAAPRTAPRRVEPVEPIRMAEVLVPPDQARAVDLWLANVSRNPGSAPVPIGPITLPMGPIEPLDIPPLAVAALVPPSALPNEVN